MTNIIYFIILAFLWLAGIPSDKIFYSLFFLGILNCFIVYLLKKGIPLLKNFTITLITIGIFLLISDQILRPIINKPLYTLVWPPFPAIHRFVPDISYIGDVSGDLSSLAQLKEGREFRNIEYITDSYGFRNKNFNPQKPIDLIFLGDSFGAGINTSQDNIFTAVITNKTKLTSYNLSIAGHSPWQEYLTFALELKRLKLKNKTTVLWVLFTGNDLDEVYGEVNLKNIYFASRTRQIIQKFQSFRNSSPINLLSYKAYSLLAGVTLYNQKVIKKTFINNRMILFNDRYVKESSRPFKKVLTHKNYKNFKKVFLALDALTKEKKIDLKIVIIPCKEEIYKWVLNGDKPWSTKFKPSGFSDAVRQLAKTNNVDFLDLKPYFLKMSKTVFQDKKKLLWWYDDTHFNDTGHKAAASVIYKNFF